MFKNFEAVIFDLDGTLVDSMWIWKQIDLEYLERKDVYASDELLENVQKDIEGMSFTETANYFKDRFNIEDSVEDIKHEWHEMSEEFYSERIKLKEGVLHLLKRIKQQNLKLGIGTSNSRELAEMVIKSNEIDDYFETLITSCDVKKGKPNPDVFLKVAEHLKVNPENCLVFEDTHAGVLAAKKAGMTAIAIYDKVSEPYMDEIKKDADDYIMTYTDLLTWEDAIEKR